MEDTIQHLITVKQCVYLEISLKNHDSFSIYMPNQDKGSVVEIVNDMLKYTQESKDGCIYENYVKMDEISYVTGVYNCPQLIRSEHNA